MSNIELRPMKLLIAVALLSILAGIYDVYWGLAAGLSVWVKLPLSLVAFIAPLVALSILGDADKFAEDGPARSYFFILVWSSVVIAAVVAKQFGPIPGLLSASVLPVVFWVLSLRKGCEAAYTHFFFWRCRCVICGVGQDRHHTWDGCVCSRCGAKRDVEHRWDGCVCAKCRQVRQHETHTWDTCVCVKCGKPRDEQHKWQWGHMTYGTISCEKCHTWFFPVPGDVVTACLAVDRLLSTRGMVEKLPESEPAGYFGKNAGYLVTGTGRKGKRDEDIDRALEWVRFLCKHFHGIVSTCLDDDLARCAAMADFSVGTVRRGGGDPQHDIPDQPGVSTDRFEFSVIRELAQREIARRESGGCRSVKLPLQPKPTYGVCPQCGRESLPSVYSPPVPGVGACCRNCGCIHRLHWGTGFAPIQDACATKADVNPEQA